MTKKARKNIFEHIRKIIEIRGEPEHIAAWEKLEPFFLERQKEISEQFLELSRWSKPSENLIFILDMIKTISGNLDMEEIYNRATDIIHNKLGFGMVLMSVRSPRTDTFQRVAQRGIPDEKYDELVNQPVPLKHYEKLMQDRFKVSHSYLVRWWHDEAQTPNDHSYVAHWDEKTEWNPQDTLLIPMYAHDNSLLGVISVDKPPRGKIPDRNVLIALEILAAQTAQAIEEARVYQKTERRLRQMEFLYDISSRSSTIENEKAFLDKICSEMREKFNLLWTGVLLTDSSTETLYMMSQSGLEDIRFSGIRYKIGREGGIIGKVAASGQYKIVDDVKKSENKYFTFHYKARSVMAVPIRKQDRVLGVLVIESEQVAAFSEEDRRFARTVTNQIAAAFENLDARRSMEEELRVRRTIFNVSSIINSILEPSRLYRKFMDILRNTFNYTSAALFLVDVDDKDYLVLKAFSGLMDRKVEEFKLKIGSEGVVGIVASTKKPIYVPDVTKFPLYIPGFAGARSELAVPIEYRGQIFGVLDVESEKTDAFSESDEQILELLATQIATAINNSILYEKLESLATTDGLTNLYNYRAFSDMLSREVKRSKRLGHPTALIFGDLDFFKSYNDKYGHQQGDKVLQLFAEIIEKNIRKEVDVPARYGGEEFTIILPEVSSDEAFDIAERIRKEFKSESKKRLLRQVTVSFGVSVFPDDGETAQKLLKSADEALYRAKSEGRDRTCLAGKKGKTKRVKKQGNDGKKSQKRANK